MVCPTCAAIRALLIGAGLTEGVAGPISESVGIPLEKTIVKTVKRRVSKYNRVYSKHFKKLKSKHPRTAFVTLSKRAHRAAKKEMK
jgi:hypothetical protein